MKTIITNDIRKEMLEALESRAEINITDDSALFRLNMDLYPHLRDHLGMFNDEVEVKGKPANAKYLSLDEAKEKLLYDYGFGYQFWDRGARLILKSWADEFYDWENESNKLYDVVSNEEEALIAELEKQLKANVDYNFNVKCFLEDVETLEELKENKDYSELVDMYDNAVLEAEELRQAELVLHQIKNIQKFVENNQNGTFKIAVDAIKELANDENFKTIAAWGAGK